MSQLYPFTDPVAAQAIAPKRIVEGDGCVVTDTFGNTYIDAVSGLWSASLGFNPPRLAAVAADQMNRLAFYHSFMGRTCDVTEELATKLVSILPKGIEQVFFGTSGSEAVETAVKVAGYYHAAKGQPERRRIIAREGAYHGSGVLSAALTGLPYCHDGFNLPHDLVLRTSRPHYFTDGNAGESEAQYSKRLARDLNGLICKADPSTIGAFIGEPVMGSGGVFLPPDGYWSEIQNVLTRHGILLIADETITGFGRTGEWFGCETYGISPDLITMAKQLSGSAFPISAVGMTGAIRDVVAAQAHEFGTFGHGVTYGGHPVGSAISLETIKIYEEMDLVQHVAKMGDHLGSLLKVTSQLPCVGDVRRVGLLAAVEFQSDTNCAESFAQAVREDAERNGVFFRTMGPTLAIAPPYICDPKEISVIGSVLNDAIRTIAMRASEKPTQVANARSSTNG